MRRFRKGGINVKYCGAVFYNAKLGIIIQYVIVLMCPEAKQLKGEKRGYSSYNGYRD